MEVTHVEHARVTQSGTVSIGGAQYTFSSFSPDGLVDPVGFVELTGPSGAVLRAPTHGCIRADHATLRVESLTAGAPAVAEIAVSPGEGRERAVPWGETVDLAIGDRVRSPDGDEVRVRTVRERLGALVWDLEARASNGPFTAIGDAGAFGGDRVATTEPTDRRDALGCPIARLTLERPSIEFSAVDGQEFRLRIGSRARLGALSVRFHSIGERRVRRGGDIALVYIEITLGTTTETRMTHFGETIDLDGYAIDVIDAGPDHARLRLRARAP